LKNAISWFELPATDLDRAMTFYAEILGTKLGDVMEADGRRYAMFPAEGVSGALVQGGGYVPSREGSLLFLDAGASLEAAVDRVEPAGGHVELARMDMGDWGVAAFIVDTEGNRVALHAART
jgi:uncharacterized protein